jgi:DNA-binding transcriptional MocR family regulator
MEENGIIPDELDSACRQHAPMAVYLIPTFHNPSTATMPLSRRKEVAEIVRRHEVLLFEDDAYGQLEPNAVPLASLVPERTYFAASLSKCIAPGLRVSLLLTPDQASAEVLVSALRASVQMPAFLMVALVTRWLQDGSAEAIIGAILNESSARQKLAANVLVQHAYSRHPNGHHIWVPLPRNWAKRSSRRMFKGKGWLSLRQNYSASGKARLMRSGFRSAPRAAAPNWSERWRSSRLH